MNKETTPLEALEALKFLVDNFGGFEFDFNTIEGALKALEIIKRYPVEVISCWDTYSDWEEYRKDYYNKAERKGLIETKEEFDLLKEVLL